MKFLLILLNVTLLSVTLSSQSFFRVKVIDEVSKESIEGAIVFIEEIPIGDKVTNRDGFVVYQNVPSDRKVRINIRKPGYVPEQEEVVANRDIGPDNNVVIELERESSEPQKIIWGEVIDSEGRDIGNARVEINLAGKVYSSSSDDSGNYRFRIKASDFMGLSSLRIEVETSNCEKYREDVNIPAQNIFNYDVQLKCSTALPQRRSNTSSSQTKKEEYRPVVRTLLEGYSQIKFTDVFYSEEGLEIHFKLFNGSSSGNSMMGLNSGIRQSTPRFCSKINYDGDIFYSSYGRIGNKECYNAPNEECYVYESVSAQTWINCKLIFSDMNMPRLKEQIPNMYISLYHQSLGNISFTGGQIPIRN